MARAQRLLLGDILKHAGLIGEPELQKALEVQRSTGQRLGDALVSLGSLTEMDIAQAMADQLNIPVLSDYQVVVNPAFAALIPPAIARRTQALPIGEERGRILVAMADPLDVFSQDEIAHLVRRSIQPAACTRTAVMRAIGQYDRLHALKQPDAEPSPSADGRPAAPEVDEGPLVDLVNDLLDRAIAQRASDIHIEPGDSLLRIRYRVDGFLREVAAPHLSHHPAIIARLKVMANLDLAERRAPQDGRIELRERGSNVDVRVSTLPTVYGEKVVLRLFDKARTLIPLLEIGFDPESLQGYLDAIAQAHGMLLVTGPTGSGKTYTLMSTLSYLNAPEKNIVTIEDPVEYQIPGVNHVQVNPRAGLSFAEGLRAILRQDPNIIMVGEIRDGETADVAVRSALTGHMVFSSLHTNDAATALTRLMDMEVEPYLVASSVLGVVAQRLVRRVCPRCRKPFQADSAIFAAHGLVDGVDPITLYRGTGCPHCNGSGFSGRLAIFEYMPISPEIQRLVTRRATTAELRRQAAGEGIQGLVRSGLLRSLAGDTIPEEVFRVVAAG